MILPSLPAPRSGGRSGCIAAHLALLELEAGCIISTWPGCPLFASSHVDQLTVARDTVLEVAA